MSGQISRYAAAARLVAFLAAAWLTLLGTGAQPAAADDGLRRWDATADPGLFDEEPSSSTHNDWHAGEQILRVVTLRDHNTRVVLLGTVLLGLTAGVVGVFMLLRNRSLVGDVVGHASLPGIAVAFVVLETAKPGSGKSLAGLLTGAAAAGLCAVLLTVAIRRFTRIKEDAALAIVLSVFFGLGVAMLTIVQDLPTGNAAGLHHFIYGKAALMVADDVRTIAKATVVVLALSVLLFKEFALVCFDQEYGAAQGWPVVRLDIVLMALVVAVTVMGLESVGLLLVVALLIVPAAAARFWTDRLVVMTAVSAGIGALSAFLGVLISALLPRLAAGSIIVLSGAALFTVSMLAGTRGGVVPRLVAQIRSRRSVGRDHLLRAFYESLETVAAGDRVPDTEVRPRSSVPLEALLEKRSWSAAELKRLLSAASGRGLVRRTSSGQYQLTAEGRRQARRVARNHRLWELYLITHADVAPSHVDRNADEIEHVLDPGLVEELENLLRQEHPEMTVPPSPHQIGGAAETEG